MKRIDFIDGYRGVAILLVILFHAYSRWALVVPYGAKFAEFPVFKLGYFGVQLFFLISGFVILMTLERTEGFLKFIYKRWLRLFPALLIASLLVYFTASLLPERPTGTPTLRSLIPGFLFLQPTFIELITGSKIDPIEGSFWSLFIEMKFYLVFGTLYFTLGRSKAILTICLMFIFYTISSFFESTSLTFISKLFSLQFCGWFAIGALIYSYFKTQEKAYIAYALLMGCLQIFNYRNGLGTAIMATIILVLFMLPIYFEKLRPIFSNKFFLFFGFISYPFYLIHENALVALIIKMHKLIPAIPDFLIPLIPVCILCLIAYFIVKIAEPVVRGFIKRTVALLPVNTIK